MSGWMILTVRARPSSEYDFSRYNESDPWDATADIAATMDADESVRQWTVWSSHVYAYLNTPRGEFDPAKAVLQRYEPMAKDAVILSANDTSDTGEARYYPTATSSYTDRYIETQREDGCYVGEMALCVINARHGIMARDPFHNEAGFIDDSYVSEGQNHFERDTVEVRL